MFVVINPPYTSCNLLCAYNITWSYLTVAPPLPLWGVIWAFSLVGLRWECEANTVGCWQYPSRRCSYWLFVSYAFYLVLNAIPIPIVF